MFSLVNTSVCKSVGVNVVSGECRCCLLSVVASWVIAATQILLSSTASAQTSGPPTDWVQEKYGWREAYGGFDVARDQWLAYSGMTFALGSPNIYSDGWRLRLGGGMAGTATTASSRTRIAVTRRRTTFAAKTGAAANTTKSDIPTVRFFSDIICSW